MVAIKGMEMPNDCKKCPLMGTDGNPKDLFSPMMCVAIWATTHEIKHCVEGKILDDCPLVEIEERKVGKWIYKKLGVRTFGIVCSNCNKVYYEGQNVGSLEEFKKDIERIMRERNVTLDEYCCHCGAEMVGIENE